MAEIEVRRRRPLIWPWIVGLTVAALLIWLLAERMGVPEQGGPEPVRSEPVTAPTAGQFQMAYRPGWQFAVP